jgi:dihydropteroate synthase
VKTTSSQNTVGNGVQRWMFAPDRVLRLDRPRVLAILNVTPDSFSDGGRLSSVDAAVHAAVQAIADGATGLDVGGESTRPGAESVPAVEQMRRIEPVIRAVRREIGREPVITVDTTQSKVAEAALDAGADAINDVSGGEDDPQMLALAAKRGCGVVLMHRARKPSADVYSHGYGIEPQYEGGVVASVRAKLRELAARAEANGVPRESVVLDPGLGFGKSVGQNLELIMRTREIVDLGYPVLSGVSRKSFVAAAAGIAKERPPIERAFASVGLSLQHLLNGAMLFRVHDVRAHVEALEAAWSATTGSLPPPTGR